MCSARGEGRETDRTGGGGEKRESGRQLKANIAVWPCVAPGGTLALSPSAALTARSSRYSPSRPSSSFVLSSFAALVDGHSEILLNVGRERWSKALTGRYHRIPIYKEGKECAEVEEKVSRKLAENASSAMQSQLPNSFLFTGVICSPSYDGSYPVCCNLR